MPFLPLTKLDPQTSRRYVITGITVLIAFLLAYALWWHYLRSPWTRDGRVRAEVVNVASQIAGQVTQLYVLDNQTVKKGDPLFEIEPVDYKLALDQAEATVQSRQLDLTIAQQDSERRQKLGIEAVSAEERNTSKSNAQVALAAYQAAVATRDQAKVNLGRTKILSPVNGYVTNLTLRVGDYATPGQTKLTLVDSDSFWIVGYFEETKLPRIHEGDYAHIRLMGWHQEIAGHVERHEQQRERRGPGQCRSDLHVGSSRATPADSHQDRQGAGQGGDRRGPDLYHRARFEPTRGRQARAGAVGFGSRARKSVDGAANIHALTTAATTHRRFKLRATKIHATTAQTTACNVNTRMQMGKSAICVLVDCSTVSKSRVVFSVWR
jgi:multidrug efflux pump subunit AcrA (membrane-fusion protein)